MKTLSLSKDYSYLITQEFITGDVLLSMKEKDWKEIFGDRIDLKDLKQLTDKSLTYFDDKRTWGKILQCVGTEVFRKQYGDNIWIEVWENRVNKLKNCGVICTDLRFKNETNYLKKMGFQLWRINATEENRKNRIETERDFNHISETDLDDYKEFDIIIENNDSLKEFEQKIIDIIEPSQIPLKKLTPEK